jgi:hypothetical protein
MPYVETAPYLPPKGSEKTQNGWISSENLFFRVERLINQKRLLTLEDWRKLYKRICMAKKISLEDKRNEHQGLHAQVALEVENEDQEADLDFLRRELSGLTLEDKGINAFKLYRLGVMCFVKPKPGSEEAMEAWGRGLIQAAFRRHQNPQFARGAIDELVLKSKIRSREKKRQRKLEKRRKIKKTEPQLLHNFNAPEVFSLYTPDSYRKALKFWQERLAKLSEGVNIDWQEFEAQRRKITAIAKKLTDTRTYDKTGIYRKVDYEEMLRTQDPEAILKGLSALHPKREADERDLEIPGFKLLELAYTLPCPNIIANHKPPQPWPAFVAYVIKEELVRKLGEVTTKPSARRMDAQDMLLRANGGIPEELRNVKTLNVEPAIKEKLPF